MGGRIGFESEVGRGTTFWFEAALNIVEAREMISAPDWSRRRLLVVDDNPTNLMIVQEYLQPTDAVVVKAQDHQAAFEAVQRSGSFDVAVLDFQMPEVDGLELAKKLHGVDPNLRIILLTSICMPISADTLSDAGVSSVLRKPIHRSHLLRELERWLEPTEHDHHELVHPRPAPQCRSMAGLTVESVVIVIIFVLPAL